MAPLLRQITPHWLQWIEEEVPPVEDKAAAGDQAAASDTASDAGSLGATSAPESSSDSLPNDDPAATAEKDAKVRKLPCYFLARLSDPRKHQAILEWCSGHTASGLSMVIVKTDIRHSYRAAGRRRGRGTCDAETGRVPWRAHRC